MSEVAQKMLRSLSMGHLGKKVDSLSTRERCFPNMEDLADSEMESKRERSMAKRAKMKRLISGAIGNELKGIRDRAFGIFLRCK